MFIPDFVTFAISTARSVENFRQLFPLASKHNLRIVAIQRRDYVGSSLFDEAELAALFSTDQAVIKGFMKDRGLEIARFLAWFVLENKIPAASADGKSGGLALLGWSAGNMTTLAFLGYIDTYPSEVVNILEPYLRTFFIYEIAFRGLGLPEPSPDGYHPLLDPAIPERLRGVTFGTWVSSYYNHTPELRTLAGLEQHIPASPRRQSTNETISPDDMLACVDVGPGKRFEHAFYGDRLRVPLYDQFCNSLFGGERRKLLPQLKVRFVYCKESIWTSLWCLWELERELARRIDAGEESRPLHIIPVQGANHFLHWDDPELALEVFSGGIKS